MKRFLIILCGNIITGVCVFMFASVLIVLAIGGIVQMQNSSFPFAWLGMVAFVIIAATVYQFLFEKMR